MSIVDVISFVLLLGYVVMMLGLWTILEWKRLLIGASAMATGIYMVMFFALPFLHNRRDESLRGYEEIWLYIICALLVWEVALRIWGLVVFKKVSYDKRNLDWNYGFWRQHGCSVTSLIRAKNKQRWY